MERLLYQSVMCEENGTFNKDHLKILSYLWGEECLKYPLEDWFDVRWEGYYINIYYDLPRFEPTGKWSVRRIGTIDRFKVIKYYHYFYFQEESDAVLFKSLMINNQFHSDDWFW